MNNQTSKGNHFRRLSGCVFFLLSAFGAQAQSETKNESISTPLVGIHWGGNLPGADLLARYGFLNNLGFSAGYKLENQWYFGLDANFIFGNKVKTTGLFDHLIDDKGNITDINGDIANVLVFPRGFNANVSIGRLFPMSKTNENSGILVHGGVGSLLHHMRIETNDQVVPQIELEYKRGYDRMTTGLNFHQFVGYSFLNNGGPLNFYAGIYFQQGLTYNRRSINFDQPDVPVSTSMRLDLQTGIRVGWYIPFYSKKPKDFYYN